MATASRYAGQPTITVPGPAGDRVLSAPRVAPRPRVVGRYDVRAGDRLDLIARAALGDTTSWWRIADANPWPDATLLERPGQTIALPDG
jgi:nucleoid-associated protein YgaU